MYHSKWANDQNYLDPISGADQKASSYALFEELIFFFNGRVNKKQWCNLQLPTNACTLTELAACRSRTTLSTFTGRHFRQGCLNGFKE